MAISTLDEYLETITNDDNRARMVDALVWVGLTYPELELRIAWNQPMFTHHGTYIIGFSAASKHMAMAPERATMIRFESVMRERGTDFGTMLARQPWNKPFDYELLDAFIQHQLAEKQDITSFWRPKEHELAAAKAVASGAQPPIVREYTEDDEEWLRATVLPALETTSHILKARTLSKNSMLSSSKLFTNTRNIRTTSTRLTR